MLEDPLQILKQCVLDMKGVGLSARLALRAGKDAGQS